MVLLRYRPSKLYTVCRLLLRHLKLYSYKYLFIVFFLVTTGCMVLRRQFSHVVFSDPLGIYPWHSCNSKDSSGLALCCPNLTNLQPKSTPRESELTFLDLMNTFPMVCEGSWKPEGCRPFQNVAVLIPYRNRPSQLISILHRLHTFLQHQKLAYTIYVIEQLGETPFNRGLLLNIGVREALIRDPTVDCFIFHDVDLLPENSANLYICDESLRHLAAGVDEFRFHVPFEHYAGGVSSLSKENVLKINGFPNRYWGWGNEDDELSARCFAHELKLSRPAASVGRYHAMRHVKSTRTSGHYENFLGFRGYMNDGLDALTNASYSIVQDPVLNEILPDGQPAEQRGSPRCSSYWWFDVIAQKGADKPLSPWQETILSAAAKVSVYTHLSVDVTPVSLQQTQPRERTKESLLWFLYFYGWI